MFSPNTLRPINLFQFVERDVSSAFSFSKDVVILDASNGDTRYCFKDPRETGVCFPFGSALVVGKDNVIKSVYTKPHLRRQGIAKQLLFIANVCEFGKIRHSDHLTASGEAWRDSVTGLNK